MKNSHFGNSSILDGNVLALSPWPPEIVGVNGYAGKRACVGVEVCGSYEHSVASKNVLCRDNPAKVIQQRNSNKAITVCPSRMVHLYDHEVRAAYVHPAENPCLAAK